jgi:hypothetical protein
MVQTGRWAAPDAEARKRGDQTGLDTPVVHAVNDAHLVEGVERFLGRRKID